MLNQYERFNKSKPMSSKFFGNRTVKNEDKTGAKKAPKAKEGAKSSSIVRKAGRGKQSFF